MKNKYLKTIALSAFTFFVSLATMNGQDTPFLQFGGKPAQDTTISKKMSAWAYITKTPWVIQVGPSVVDDDDAKLKDFNIKGSENFFPFHVSAEKRIKNKFGVQFAISSESIKPHNFWSTDINLKYNFLSSSIGEKKIFDPYAMIGGGHTYRDFPHAGRRQSGKDNSINANVGAGANFWIFDNAAIFVEGVAKFVLLQNKYNGSNYLHYTAGLAFKIGTGKAVAKVVEPTVVPSNYQRSKEAQEAADYLRQILNK